ncbi:MAG: DivIVA domain-containing protein [Actinomycetota bacterium]|nr:DivIVA domain-containing protein [Actinomycetota bacterium]
MLTLLAVLGVLGALFLAAALATREDQALAPAPPDAADLALPTGPLTPDDVRGVRFGMALRGYRMREVDVVLDRLAEELADRDRRLAALEGRVPGEPTAGNVADHVSGRAVDDHEAGHRADDRGRDGTSDTAVLPEVRDGGARSSR